MIMVVATWLVGAVWGSVSSVCIKEGWVGENEPQLSSWFVMGTYWMGLPFFGSPLMLIYPHSSVARELATHIPLERGGVTAASSSLLRWVKAMLVVPTSLNRGEGHMSRWLKAIESEMGQGGQMWWWWDGWKMNEHQLYHG